MVPNTSLFADFIKAARTNANLTQDNLHDRGATYRQMQGRIENTEPIELDKGVLAAYERAYNWPAGYAEAVARAAAYASGYVEPPIGIEHLAQKTLAGVYDPEYRGAAWPVIGFDPTTGSPVGSFIGIVTNISLNELLPVINSRKGATLLDTQLLDADTARRLCNSPVADRPRKLYRLAEDQGAFKDVAHLFTPIALDVLTDISGLGEARRLARVLLELFGGDTTVERAAFTFAAIAGFGEDPFTTIRHLQTAGPMGVSSLSAHAVAPELKDFAEFWIEFCARYDVSAKLAVPDLEALRLLDNLSDARERAKSSTFGPPVAGARRYGQPVLPSTVRALPLITDTDNDNVIVYDGDVAPQVPVCVKNLDAAAVLAIYQARPGGLLSRSDSYLNTCSIGIDVGRDDLSLIALYRQDALSTLTNLFGRYAVFCDSRRASVVWIPDA